jgi:hypothetical protein
MTSSNVAAATNSIPQVTGVVVTYTGDLANNKYISLVDATLNSNNPCVLGSIAGAAADSTHSGKVQAGASDKRVTIPQSTLLEKTKTFAVCYAETDGATTDATWADSYIRLKISMIESVSSHSVTHKTSGQIARVSTLQLTYAGSLANNLWVSLVDQTLGGTANFPCATGTVAAASASTAYSGPQRAGGSDKIVTLDTTVMSTSKTFAVCYTEGNGGTSASWIDAGIRITLSKVTLLKYGSPAREMPSPNTRPATNRLPQSASMSLIYSGDLPHNKFLSIVWASYNTNNPCVDGLVAASGADSTHSGAQQAPSGSSTVSIPQTTLLDDAYEYAVCYAESSGSTADTTWADSYVRLKISRIQTISTLCFILFY